MIEIRIGAGLVSQGQEVGRIERVILDRETEEVTHLVVRHGGPLQARSLLLPLAWVRRATHEQVETDRTEEEIEGLPNFETRHFVTLDHLAEEQGAHPGSKIRPADWIHYLVPLVANAFGDPYHTPGVIVTDPLLSASESAIRRGMPIEASDGHRAGELLEVLLSEPDRRLSGLMVGRGPLLSHSLRIPADWIDRFESDRIVLRRTRAQIDDWEKEPRQGEEAS
jgi:sporulation protein YlmC with PRC-barrel domain